MKAKMINDRIIALDMLGGSVAATSALNAVAMAADNSDLQRLYKELLQDSLMAVETLKTYVSDQGWMNHFATPDEQLKIAIEHADEVVAVRA